MLSKVTFVDSKRALDLGIVTEIGRLVRPASVPLVTMPLSTFSWSDARRADARRGAVRSAEHGETGTGDAGPHPADGAERHCAGALVIRTAG